MTLRKYYDILDNSYHALSQFQTKQRSTRLGQLHSSISTRFFEPPEEADLEQIEKIITKMYFLTEDILSELQIINKPNYSIVYSDSAQGIYAKAPDGQLALSKGAYLEKHRGAWTLRFQASLSQIAQANKTVNKQQFYNAQYEKFTSIIKEHLGGKIPNEGHLVEAYERFQESKKSKMYKSAVIKYYWQSTGRDPYYTGPDTELSQVKAQNATITSVNTILYTTQTILSFLNGAQPSPTDIKNAFMQGNGIAHNQLRQVIQQGVPRSVQKMLEKNFGKYLNT